MATLQDLRNRRKSVLSTQKITLAMKMVAGAKLRRAQERVEAGRPYAHLMSQMVKGLATNARALETPQPLLTGTGKSDTHLLLVATSDRGLCGAFNTAIVRQVRGLISSLEANEEKVSLFCVGRKGYDILKKEYQDQIIETFTEVGVPRLRFTEAQRIADSLIKMYEDGLFDRCSLVYNHFKSAMTQIVTTQQLIPVKVGEEEDSTETQGSNAIYEYEPAEETILSQLLPQNVAVQVYTALLESSASEQGARMTAMDNASRNADDMIRGLTLTYNRTRQAHITRELIEIISGAEAL